MQALKPQSAARIDWEQRMHRDLAALLDCSEGDARDIAEAQADTIERCWVLRKTHEECAAAVDKASTPADPGRQPEAADTLTCTLTYPDQACYDLMCTAIEGGINYWADVGKRTRAPREGSTISDYTSFEADVQDGPVTCDHPDIEAAEIGRFTIDPGMIRDGIRRLLAPGAQISPAIRNDVALLGIDGEHAPDADSADAIVQFAVFGELVFG